MRGFAKGLISSAICGALTLGLSFGNAEAAQISESISVDVTLNSDAGSFKSKKFRNPPPPPPPPPPPMSPHHRHHDDPHHYGRLRRPPGAFRHEPPPPPPPPPRRADMHRPPR